MTALCSLELLFCVALLRCGRCFCSLLSVADLRFPRRAFLFASDRSTIPVDSSALEISLPTKPVPMDQYQLANAVEKVAGYYLPRASDVTDRHLRAFERAKAECTEHLAKQLENVQSLTFEQFCSAKKIKAVPATTA